MHRHQQRRTGLGSRAAEVVVALFLLASSGGSGGRGGRLNAIMPGVNGVNYCDSVPASSAAGNYDLVSDFTDEHDFACEDGYFLESVTVWADVFVESMVWRQVCVRVCVRLIVSARTCYLRVAVQELPGLTG